MMSMPQQCTHAGLVGSAEQALDDGDIGTARSLFDQAEDEGADPDRCSAGRWMCAMYEGDFASAWGESDAIRARGAPDPHRFWNGEPIDGCRVIVRCLHGLGDAVQMLRYVPQLRQRCAKVIVEVPPGLMEIATCFDGVDCAITWGDRAPAIAPAWDVQIEVTELPYLFRTTAAELPLACNYLTLGKPRAASLRMPRSSIPRVGLVWAAGEWNASRSLPFSAVEEIVVTEGVEFWSLQGGSRRNEWQTLADHSHLHDMREHGDGLGVLASLTDALDLVITVDTLAAHLAGALGKPAWLLLQHTADWRWMTGRRDSPWYPSLRLFRQRTAGTWDEVIADVKTISSDWIDRFSCAERMG